MPKRKKGSNTGIPGLSFSWRRATGVTAAKRKISRATGVPTTRGGRQRKVGRAITGGGCLLPILVFLITIASVLMLII